ncbi:MAG TPA: hypothetical protein DHN29_24155, partial [Cytophagales bacterium]|nr:hypothetical protein [Cytophagales bacterium]
TSVNINSVGYTSLANSGDSSTYTFTMPDFGSALDQNIEFIVRNTTRLLSDTSSAVRVYFEPDVVIVSPTGVEERKFAETIDITWLNADLGVNDNFNLRYSLDGGVTSVNINSVGYTSLTNSGDSSTYTFTMPDFGSVLDQNIEFIVRNTTRLLSDTSNAVRVYFEPDVVIVSPTGVEERKFAETIDITWLNADLGINDNFNLRYSLDGGVTSVNINSVGYTSLTNSGDSSTYTFTMPDFGSALDQNIEFIVRNTTRLLSDTSNAVRVYFEPLVDVVSPVNGQFVSQGATLPITWLNADLGINDNFNLRYSLDGGATSVNINSVGYTSLTNSGDSSTYNWTVPAIESTSVKMIVRNTSRNVSDTTLSFTICATCPGVALYYPNGGELFQPGETVDLGWTLGSIWNTSDNISIDFSEDNGVSYSNVFSGTYSEVADDTYSWTVPSVQTTEGLIKITNTTSGEADSSDAVFTVALPPAAPIDLFAVENVGNSITLTWTDTASTETGFRVQYSTDNVAWTNYSAVLAADTETYTTSTLSSNTAYWWRVVSLYNSLSSPSNSRYAGAYIAPGRALNFDGTDDKVDIEGITTFQNTQNFSIELWSSFDALGGFDVFFVCGSSGTQRVDLQLDGAGGSLLGVVSNGSEAYGRTATILESSKWYHIVMTFDGTQSLDADRLKIYINGVQDVLTFTGSIPTVTGSLPSGVTLGTYYDGTFQFSGSLDELRVWNYTLTESEINDHMLSTLIGNESGLDAYYRFDQPAGSDILPDRSIFTNDGSWSGLSGTNSAANWISSGAFADPSPSITVVSPNGTESYNVADTIQVSWNELNIEPTDSIAISFSVVSDGDFILIDKGLSSTYSGVFDWVLPDSITTQALIQVENLTQSVSDQSDNFFTINAQIIPSVTVVDPNGGEFVETGTNYTVSWSDVAFASSDNIAISLSMDGGSNFSILSQGTSGTTYPGNTFSWDVGDSTSTTALIMVENITQDLRDTSDAVFTIGSVDRSITLLTPNGGEEIVQGSAQTVSFEVEGLLLTDVLIFELSLDSGSTFPYLIAQAPLSIYTDSTFQWTVSQPVSSQAYFRASVSAYGIADTTDTDFSIVEPNLAPSFDSYNATIIGDELTLDYALNEAGTVYMVVLEDGNAIPNASQMKDAATGGQALTGQIVTGNFTYDQSPDVVREQVASAFVRQSLFDIYLTAEDGEGNLNDGLAIPNVLAQYSPLESDSIVVSTIYNVLGGETWQNTATDWNTLALSERSEIVVENDRISVLNLSDKAIEGSLGTEVLGLDSLKVLLLSGNSFEGIPLLTGLTELTTLDVSDNQIDLGDLELNADLFTEDTQYSPQANIGTRDSLTIPQGSSYSFDIGVGGVNNTYQWKADYYNTFEENFVDVEGETTASLTISALGFDNMATYQLEIQNPLLPGLVVNTEPVQLWATANLDFTVYGDNDILLDQGSAYALRNQGPGLPFDSIPKLENGSFDPEGLVFTNGKVIFENLLLGDYLIAIRSDPNSYLPTYYKNTFLWEEADTLTLRQDVLDTMTMFTVPPALTPADGSGTLAGTVESDFNADENEGRIDARRKVKRAGCSIRRFVPKGRTDQDEEGEFELIAYVESDDEGKFKIENIPAGLYRFNIEYPGIPMDEDSYVEFEIGEEGSTSNSIELQATVTEDGIFVERINLLSASWSTIDVSIYPNPATDYVSIDLAKELKGHLIRIVDVKGREYLRKIYDGESVIKWETVLIPDGMYFLNIVDLDAHQRTLTRKIVVRH